MKILKYLLLPLFFFVFVNGFSQQIYRVTLSANDYWHLNPHLPRPELSRLRVIVYFNDGSEKELLYENGNPYYRYNLGPEDKVIKEFEFDNDFHQVTELRFYYRYNSNSSGSTTIPYFTSCGGFAGTSQGGVSYNVDVFPVINISRSGNENDLAGYLDPIEIEATSGFPVDHYGAWQYQIGVNGAWTDISNEINSSTVPHILKVIPEDFLPTDVINDPEKSVNFRIKTCKYYFPSENVLNYRITNSAPHISAIVPENVSCYDSSDGEVTIEFDRALKPNEFMNIAIADLTKPNNDGLSYATVKNENDVVLDGENKITVNGLPAGEGEYAIQMVVGLNGNIYYSDGDSHSEPFRIEKPENPVDFEIKEVVHVYCNNGSDGEIHLLASGGWDGDYEYKIFESDEATKNWGAEEGWVIFEEDYTHVIKNRKPNINYEIKVRKKLNNGVYCYAKIQVPLDGSIALAEEKILNQLLEQPERELQVEYPENGSTEPSANGYSNGSIKVKIWGGTPNADGKYNVQWTNGNDVLDVSNIEIKDEVDEQGRVYKANYLTLSNIPQGTYYLTVTDDNFDDATDEQGCTIINSEWTLNQPEPLSIEIEESKSISCYGETGGELIAHAEGGVELEVTDNGGLPYYYTWKKKNEEGNWITLSETSEKLSDIGSGVYAVNIKDAKGIIIGRSENNVVVEPEDVTYTLTEPELLEIKHNSKIDVYCHGGNDGSIDVAITGGTAPYTIEWQSDQLETNRSTEDLTGLTAGTYYINVTDAKGCKTNAIVEIEEPGALLVNYPNDFFQPTASGLTNGWIEATIAGGTPTAEGAYLFEWRDENNNLVNSQVVTTVDAATGVCTLRLESIGRGTYTLAVRDANEAGASNRTGCQALDLSYELEEPGPLELIIEETSPISCNSSNEYNNPSGDGELTAHASGGVQFGTELAYKYTWKKKNEQTSGWEVLPEYTGSVASGLNAGEYAVNIEDKNGIVLGEYENNVLVRATDKLYALVEPDLLEVSFDKQDVYCIVGSDGWIEAQVTGGTAPYQFMWNTGEDTGRISSLEAGTYEVIVTDSRGCEVIGAIEIEEPEQELFIDYRAYGRPSSIGAADGWIEVFVSGGTAYDNGSYVYNWTNSSDDELNGQTQEELINESGQSYYKIRLINIPSGSYYLTIEDKNYEVADTKFGCTLIESEYKLSEPIEAIIEVYNPVSCNSLNGFLDPSSDGALVARVEGGIPFSAGQPYNYIWKKLDENGQWVILEGQDTEIASGLGAGMYALNVEDSHGTIIGTYKSGTLIEAHDVFFEFEEPELLQVEINSTDISCDAGNDGTISVSISGGVPGYEIQWSTGETTPQIRDVIAGKYIVYVTDARGCQATAEIEIGQPGGIEIQAIEQRGPTCFGGNDGALQLEVTGGTAPYSYLWNTGNTNPFITNLSEGNYELRVTDAEGCIAYVQYKLEDPEPVIVDLGEDRTICMDQGIIYDITIDDPDAIYQWESDNGFSSSSPVVELQEGGTYRATVTSSLGCVGNDELTINVSSEAIDAYFLLTTQAFAGEEVILVNVSNPIGEEVEWTVPEGVKKVYEEREKLIVHFEQAGTYNINLRSYQGSCYQDYTKKIIVEEATELPAVGEVSNQFIDEFIVYPNPTDGEFKVKISLEEEAKISLKIISLTTSQVINNRIEGSTSEYLLDYHLDLVPGLYILLLETPNGDEVRKIVFK